MDSSASAPREPLNARQAIARGWSKKCPHCGQGQIFKKWTTPFRNCPVCGYLYERDYGDLWWVLIVTDRIPVAIAIVFVFFGFRITSWQIGVAFFGLLAIPLLITMPRRQGLGIAMAYLSRRKWPDSDDPIPVLDGTRKS